MILAATGNLNAEEVTRLFLSLGVLLGAARLLGEMARRFGQPSVLGEILAGILLGPTVLGAFDPTLMAWLFPMTGGTAVALNGFTTIAVALLLLVAGLEVDLSTIWRQGRATLWVGATGIFFPFTLGFLIALPLAGVLGKNPDGPLLPFALFIGIAMSITALPVIAKILMDLNMFRSDMGMLIMSAAMLNDLVGWLGFAMVLALLTGEQNTASFGIGSTLGLTVVFVVGILTIGRWVAHRALPIVQAHSSWPGGVLGFILVSAMLCASFTEHIGIHAIFGAFLAGVAIGDSSHLRERTRDTLHQFVTNIFAPVFFASIGVHINFVQSFDLAAVLIVLVIAFVGKVGGCYLGAVWAGMGKRESWAIGFGMSARGAMEIVLGQAARQANLITDELFVAIIIMALVTSLASGPAIQRLVKRTARRRLSDMLADRHMVINMGAVSARQAIQELAGRAAPIAGISAESIAHAVWQREQMMRTALEHGLAVPHARLAGLRKSIVLIGTSNRGIDFDSPDGEPARIICMLLTPTGNQTEQIELLAMVAHAFIEEETRRRVQNATSSTELLAAIRVAESHGQDTHALAAGE